MRKMCDGIRTIQAWVVINHWLHDDRSLRIMRLEVPGDKDEDETKALGARCSLDEKCW